MRFPAAHLALAASTACAAMQAFAGAEIVRCVDSRGAITYQEIACPASTNSERTSIPTDFPAQNLAERDRLFAREAALDRRLEARRERELREAQARAERGAERERQAAMLAAAQAAQPQYLVVYPVRHWAPAHRRVAPAGATNAQPIFR